jgi:hypothetical protein
MTNRNALSERACLCKHPALSFSSPLLFLAIVLPRSSYAQLTGQLTPTIPTTLLTSASSNPSTTLARSATAARPTEDSPPTAVNNPDNDSPPGSSISSTGAHAFNYYFVIVAVAAIFFCIAILYFSKRKKQKAALMRSNSQRALAQDVARFNPRTRGGRVRNNGRVFWNGIRREEERVEGLDERGEAPPPYVPGGKPPSIRVATESVDLADRSAPHSRIDEAVELNTLPSNTRIDVDGVPISAGGDPPPPGYHEHTRQDSEDIGNITRPTAAITTPDGPTSSRRLLGSSNGSTV